MILRLVVSKHKEDSIYQRRAVNVEINERAESNIRGLMLRSYSSVSGSDFFLVTAVVFDLEAQRAIDAMALTITSRTKSVTSGDTPLKAEVKAIALFAKSAVARDNLA